MALATTAAKTAWGDIQVKMGPTGEGDSMSTNLESLGYIKDDNFTISTTDGTTYELKDINGKVLDKIQQQPSMTLNFGLVKIPEAVMGKFWTLTEDGSGDARKVGVSNLITNASQSIEFSNPKAIGSETFEAPKCAVKMNLEYAKDTGFTASVEATLLWPETQGAALFSFGKVTE